MPSIHDAVYSPHELNHWILEAHTPENTSGDGDRAKTFHARQFKRMQTQAPMRGITLCFPEPYERAYRQHTEEMSVVRIRVVFAMGSLLLCCFLLYDYYVKQLQLPTAWLVVDICAGHGAFVAGLLLSFMPPARRLVGMEAITTCVFAVVAVVLIAKKPLQGERGPVLELVVLLIPIFGITRMRFVTSCTLGFSILAVYLAVQLTAAHLLDDCDPPKAIMTQTFNYAIRVVGGVVAHYRQELLRRRNFALELPVAGVDVDNVRLQDKFVHHELIHRWHLDFYHRDVDSAFLLHWYLLDPCPYDDIHDALLHRRVARALRGPFINAVMSQVLLLIQDFVFFHDMPSVQTNALLIRLGLVVPAYVAFMGAVYVLSHLYSRNQVLQRRPSALPAFVVDPTNGGYVPAAQVLSGVVVSIHIAAMATLVLYVYSVTHDASTSDVYLMGLLNAVLFVHRSGFRIRFVVATYTTTAMILLFVLAMVECLPRELWLEYAIVTVAVVVLGAVTSHEEESLRRVFFIVQSVRRLHFRAWFQTLDRVPLWMRRRLVKRLECVRAKLAHGKPWLPPEPQQDETIQVPAELAAATFAGIYCQVVEALVDVVAIVAV
ncbi:hypothetical protein AC1031_016390 [Aphanomyces cochlioides]|nr:hypothetical protein AC1031_016390 [Aphanomyces cochlioides]